MLTVSWKSDGVRVTDDANKTVRVEGRDWTRREETDVSITATLSGRAIGPDDPSAVVRATASRLTFPSVYVAAVSLDGMGQFRFGSCATNQRLPEGEYLLRIETNVRAFLRVNGPLRLDRDSGEQLTVQFPETSDLELAFASRVSRPAAKVTVPQTAAGVAAGLSTLGSANEVVSPDRTWPTLRGRPPLLGFGDSVSVPDAVEQAQADTDVSVIVPDDLSALLPVASLAAYLSADVRVESGTEPLVEVGDRTHRLGSDRLHRRASALLRRTFFLDCVARTAGPHGGPLSVTDTFDTLGLDAERLYETPIAERVRTYLAADFQQVADRFPDWHLSMHIAPTYEHVTVLPYLVDTLPFILPPRAEPLSESKWLEKSLTGGGFGPPSQTETLRGPTPGTADSEPVRGFGRRTASNVDLLDPELGPGRVHGWLAEGTPIDVFKATPEAYRHRDEALDDPGTGLSVTAVVNQMGRGFDDTTEMRTEHTTAVDHYRTRADELNADIRVERNVTTAELARIFESPTDLVHFVGHHEEAGLEGVDGFLDADSIDRSRARTFFLNACGSYPFGESLVRNGSIAGGVTLASITDSDAAAVGTTFARLLIHGYSLGRGLATAARSTIAPRDYLIVGDFTFRPSQSDSGSPSMRWVIPDGDDEFRVLVRTAPPLWAGAEFDDPLDNVTDRRYLCGEGQVFSVSRDRLCRYLSDNDAPVIYQDELYWAEELHDELRCG